MRAIVAFLVAPLVGPLVLAGIFLTAYVFDAGPRASMPDGVEAATRIAGMGLLKSYEATIFVGGPLYLLFRGMKWTRIGPSLIAGGMVALVPLYVSVDAFGRVSWDGPAGGAYEILQPMLLFIVAGVATGLAFWLAAFAPLKDVRG